MGTAALWMHRVFALVLAGAAGWVLVGAGLALDLSGVAAWGTPAAVVLVLHAVARRYPLQLLGRGRTWGSARAEFTTGTAFGFAALVLAPAPVALVGLGLGALVPARHSRRTLRSAVLEVARVVLVYAAAGASLTALREVHEALLGGGLEPSLGLLLLLLPAGLVAYLADAAIQVTSIAISTGAAPRAVLRQDRAALDLPVFLLLVALAPIVVVVAERSLLLLPLLIVAVVGLYRSSRAAASQQHHALHDQLTGLGNRRLLEHRLTELIDRADLDDRFALLLLDLDRFKEVNDRLGHHVGDELLAQVGARLGALDGPDLATRIGGDEFALVLRRVGDHPELVALAERLVTEVARPYVVSEVRLAVGASVGVALFPDHGLDMPSLLRRADSAMYAAKRSGVAVGVATVRDPGTAPGRVSLLGELEEAMRRDHLRLDYQPKVSLGDGAVVGVEALLRWHHPERGLVPPSAFISTVEHTELIAPLTRHVITTALTDIGRWRVAGVEVPVAINVSTRDLQDTRFPRDLARLLAEHSVRPSSITLEITETALQVDPDRAGQVLAELREVGLHLSIDDFGTGYSSLAALRRLPVTELKIDRIFVLGMDEGAAGRAIVRSIIDLAHALDLHVVAEGVEDEGLLRLLQEQGCDAAQGYLLSRPLPAHLVAPWVRARRAERASALASILAPGSRRRVLLPGEEAARVAAGVEAPGLRPLIEAV